jgi:hypothetical protein
MNRDMKEKNQNNIKEQMYRVYMSKRQGVDETRKIRHYNEMKKR